MAAMTNNFLPTKQRHPITDEPFVKGSVESKSSALTEHWLKPRPPERALYDLIDVEDDAVSVYVRDLTDEEFAAATAEYEAALERWYRANCDALAKGPRTVTGRFETESGSTASGVQKPDGEWVWIDVTVQRSRE